MAQYQITHTRKDGTDADHRIDAVKIETSVFGIDQIIEWILNRSHQFWVSVQGRSVWVEVRRHATSGRYFLTTEGDGFPPNNLLRLPDC